SDSPRIESRSTHFGSEGDRSTTRDVVASTDNPRQACSIMNTAPEAHACGEHATGYEVGALPSRLRNPQKSSGRRLESKYVEASSCAMRMRSASDFEARLVRPAAMIALSWGQMEPLWYAIGL